MIKKSITFKNYLGQTETEDYYFNLSKGELVLLQLSAIDQRTESFQDKLEKLGKDLQGEKVVDIMQEFIEKSYGVRSTDGRKFIKSPELIADFKSTGAYSELIVDLFKEGGTAFTEFVNGLMPADLKDEVNKEVASTLEARKRSEANLQGHNQKTVPSVQVVPSLPTTVLPASAPVLESAPTAAPEVPSADQIAAYLRANPTAVQGATQ